VRPIGIDAPEKVPQKPAQCFGKEAPIETKEILSIPESDPTQGDRKTGTAGFYTMYFCKVGQISTNSG
jgi:hypothetical protein